MWSILKHFLEKAAEISSDIIEKKNHCVISIVKLFYEKTI